MNFEVSGLKINFSVHMQSFASEILFFFTSKPVRPLANSFLGDIDGSNSQMFAVDIFLTRRLSKSLALRKR